jgi:hypothetical protein
MDRVTPQTLAKSSSATSSNMYTRAGTIWHDMELSSALSSDDRKRREALHRLFASDGHTSAADRQR